MVDDDRQTSGIFVSVLGTLAAAHILYYRPNSLFTMRAGIYSCRFIPRIPRIYSYNAVIYGTTLYARRSPSFQIARPVYITNVIPARGALERRRRHGHLLLLYRVLHLLPPPRIPEYANAATCRNNMTVRSRPLPESRERNAERSARARCERTPRRIDADRRRAPPPVAHWRMSGNAAAAPARACRGSFP
ncbi:hypothetical protein EVAR_40685_1 [Eumeta japonica]|uniref:Uncharacterized protein n=1 Tax=Eumeta variegata TaxID=151549 RepID=A0A4C1X8D0_EUMVA|nr:hypothetical protein EVAR_40685_1 [Eumeta japonica]